MLTILGIALQPWLWLTILGALCFFLGWLFNYWLLGRGAKADCFEEERTRLRTVEGELKTAVASRDKVQAEYSASGNLRSKLEGDLKGKVAELAAATAAGVALKATVDKLTGEKDGHSKELTDWKSRYSKLEGDLKVSNEAKLKLESDVKAKAAGADTEWNTKLGAKDKEIADWKARYTKLETDIKGNDDKHGADLKTRAAELAAAVAGGAALKATVDKLTGEKDGHAKELADWKARYAKLEGDLKTAQTGGTAELNDLRTRNTKLDADLKAANERYTKLDTDHKKLDTDHKAHLETYKGKTAELAAAVAGGALLQSNISKLTGERDTHAKELADLKTRNTKLEADLKSAQSGATAELADLRARVAKQEADLKATNESKAKVEADHKNKAAELATAAAAGAAATAAVSKLTGERDTHAKDLADWKARYAKLEADHKAAAESTTKFESSVKAKDTELADWKARHAKAEADLKAANDTKAKIEAEHKNKAAELAAAAASGAAATAAVSKLTGERDTHAKDLADWKARYAKLEADQKAAADARAKADADLRAANDARAKADAEAKGKATELAAAVAGGATLQASISKLTSERDGSAREAAELRARVGSLQSEVNNLNADKNALTAAASEANSLKGQVGELRASNNNINSELARLRGDRETAIRERDEARAKLLEAEARAKAAPPAPPAAAAGVNKFALSGTAEMKQAGAAAKEAARKASGGKEVTSRCPQHLSDVKGIGTVFEGRLYGSDIGTYWELGHLADDDFKKILEIKDMDMIRVSFEDTRKDAIRIARETNTVGRTWTAQSPDDFEPLEGIGYTYEKRLYDAGICTYESLAACNEAQLEKICITGRRPPKMPEFSNWVAQAKKLVKK